VSYKGRFTLLRAGAGQQIRLLRGGLERRWMIHYWVINHVVSAVKVLHAY
jgi:hypothetical protein